MPRYIDADAFDERIRVAGGFAEEELTADFKDGILMTLELLKTQPTADVVEVVRCKDCSKKEYCRTVECWAFPPSDDWFCADGDRREDE